MYEAHFGLKERPFSIAPDPDYLFLSQNHRDALAHLSFGIAERGGFIQLTGVVGTGKTTLTRALLEQLPSSVDMAFLLNPTVTARELLVAICEELQIDVPSRNYSIPTLMSVLRDYLLDAFARGRHTVVLIDEAQNLSKAALEQVRMLTNLETNREKLLQIILVGQPELRALLAKPDLQQVAQRVTARYHLVPLRFAETQEYIRHRVRVAGVDRRLFSRAACLIIHNRARGIPRLINIICDRALLGAYARNRQRVTAGIALHAATEVLGQRQRWLRPLRLAGVAAIAGLLLWGTIQIQWTWPPLQPETAAADLQSSPHEKPGLIDYMRRNDPQLDTRVALGELFALWGIRFHPDSRLTACEQARQQDLRCHTGVSSWETLRNQNLPVVLELHHKNDARYGVVLTGIEHDMARIRVGETTMRLAADELRNSWTGNTASLWRPPFEVSGTIMPGQRGPAVIWLRRQLDRIDGRPAAAIVSDLYDSALRQRVDAFQRDHNLAVDGIVGEVTLFHLMLAAPQAGMPQLRRS